LRTLPSAASVASMGMMASGRAVSAPRAIPGPPGSVGSMRSIPSLAMMPNPAAATGIAMTTSPGGSVRTLTTAASFRPAVPMLPTVASSALLMRKPTTTPTAMAAAVGTAGMRSVVAAPMAPGSGRVNNTSVLARFAAHDSEVRLMPDGRGVLAHRMIAAQTAELAAARTGDTLAIPLNAAAMAATGGGGGLTRAPTMMMTASGGLALAPTSPPLGGALLLSSPPMAAGGGGGAGLSGTLKEIARQRTAVDLFRKTGPSTSGGGRPITPPPNIKRPV
jgi:hypothetical protein